MEIEVEAFEEGEDLIRIGAVIMVERGSQKGIIIGHKGTALKRVGSEARKDLETFFDKKVYLELFVKVNKNFIGIVIHKVSISPKISIAVNT